MICTCAKHILHIKKKCIDGQTDRQTDRQINRENGDRYYMQLDQHVMDRLINIQNMRQTALVARGVYSLSRQVTS